MELESRARWLLRLRGLYSVAIVFRVKEAYQLSNNNFSVVQKLIDAGWRLLDELELVIGSAMVNY